MRVAILLGITLTISSCSTMSPQECKGANWKSVGYEDGSNGKSKRLSDYIKDCAEAKVRPDSNLYMSGYNAGEKVYCTYDNGLRRGKKGKSASSVCNTAGLRQNFDKGYTKGKEQYQITSKIKDKESDINKIDRKIKKIAKGKEKADAKSIDLLYREKTLIRKEIELLQKELNSIR